MTAVHSNSVSSANIASILASACGNITHQTLVYFTAP